MSARILTLPVTRHVQPALAIGLITILVIISVGLIIGAIWMVVSPIDQDGIQADPISVVQNSISPIPVPMTPLIQVSSGERLAIDKGILDTSVIALPVPTPPVRGNIWKMVKLSE